MRHRYVLPFCVVGALLTPAGSVWAQALTLLGITPAANASVAPRNTPVTASFSQPLTAASAGALKVFSSQRGGLRTTATPAVVSGSTLTFTPTPYPFMPGEMVQVSVTRAASGSGGALAVARVQQFTAAAGGTGRGFFGGSSSLFMGFRSGEIVVGDLDSDGDPDFVAATSTIGVGNGVNVRLNNGAGTFISVPTQPISNGNDSPNLVLGDVDGDGDLDLVAAAPLNNTVYVLLNNGAGTFSGSQSMTFPSIPEDVALGDVDGDGDLDFVTVNSNNTASIRLNDGTGGFGGSQNVSIGGPSRNVVLADIDNDGDLDLLTANGNAKDVSVRLNNGAGTFSGSQSVPLGDTAGEMTMADIDNDGDLDLLVPHSTHGTVSVHRNNGAGTFTIGQLVNLGIGASPGHLALVDVDADGDLDLVATIWANYVNLRLNDGTGTFSSGPIGPNIRTITVGSTPRQLALSDLDGDGDLDLLCHNGGDNTVSVRFNQPTDPLATRAGATHAPLLVYPNPTCGAFTIAGLPPHAVVEVLDALGRVVARASAVGTAPVQLPAGLPAGLYLLRSGTQVQRLIVE